MGACTVKGDDSDFCIFLVEQEPVWIDMAFPIAFVVAAKKVIV